MIPDVIKQCHSSGEFIFHLQHITDENEAQRTPKEAIAYLAAKENELKEIEGVLLYLIAEGFIENRHDINDGSGRLFRQLTDKGRKLKQLNGDLIAFYKWDKKNAQTIKRDDWRKRNWLLLSIIGYLFGVASGLLIAYLSH